MKMFKWILNDFIPRLYRPNFWIMLYKADSEWDKVLNKIIDNIDSYDVEIDNYNIKINKLNIWVRNYPYAYGNPRIAFDIRIRPYVKTIIRLNKVVDKYRKQEIQNLLEATDEKH